jgi:hypothetical protein
LYWQKNSKTKVEKAFFFFYVFLGGNEFLKAQSEKKSPNKVNNFLLLQIGRVELWHSIPRVAFLAFTKTNKILKEKLG